MLSSSIAFEHLHRRFDHVSDSFLGLAERGSEALHRSVTFCPTQPELVLHSRPQDLHVRRLLGHTIPPLFRSGITFLGEIVECGPYVSDQTGDVASR